MNEGMMDVVKIKIKAPLYYKPSLQRNKTKKLKLKSLFFHLTSANWLYTCLGMI